jgi:protein-arginine kinase activator protein McsA
MPEDPLTFEELLPLRSDTRESLRQDYAIKICPQCRNAFDEGYGSGQIEEGLFCGVECYLTFRDKLINIIRLPERS